MEEEEETFEQKVERTGGFPVLAVHRGGGAEFAPENTMYAFERCLECGARLLETDLRLTRDGELCLMHDSSVERTTDGAGPVYAYTLEEVQQLDAAHHYPALRGRGIHVPSFAEFLARFAPLPDLLFLLDFKDEAAARRALEMVAEYPALAARCMVGSVFEAPNRYLREKRASPAQRPCVSDMGQTFAATIAYGTGAWPLYRFEHEVFGFILRDETARFWSRGLVEAVRARGVRVLVCGDWVSRVEVMRDCVAWGVEYIMTDRPDLLCEVVAAFGGEDDSAESARNKSVVY